MKIRISPTNGLVAGRPPVKTAFDASKASLPSEKLQYKNAQGFQSSYWGCVGFTKKMDKLKCLSVF